MNKFILKKTVDKDYSGTASDFLSLASGLSKVKVKDAMNKGAVWIKKRGKLKRLRQASTRLHAGDCLEFYYDKQLLSKKPPDAQCLHDLTHYSVWLKPGGLMSQGTKFGDHCSLLRQAERFFKPGRQVFPVHRLDREASGVIMIAHSRESAGKLSRLFQKNEVKKEYRVEVLGNLNTRDNPRSIALPLDHKPAVTELAIISYDPERNVSVVRVIMRTGRYHQIRRHFNMIGCPVMGDPRYGRGNKNIGGMKLAAVALQFQCPFLKKTVEFRVPDQS
jgi:tRNA pseudouridine32 synthase/23S rRNA pseudouridine746 synthase